MIRPQLPVLMLLVVPAVSFAAPDEVLPSEGMPCFPGAYYRKAVSSTDTWDGIEGIITLPKPAYDAKRVKPNGRHLDNASIYLGGRVGEVEIDSGLSWEVTPKADGSVPGPGTAYRPFWRNTTWSTGPAKSQFYYYPGDTVRMRVETLSDGKLSMRIDLLDRAGGAEYKPSDSDGSSTSVLPIAEAAPLASGSSTVPADALSSLSVSFDAVGFGPGKLQEYKRVNAIDQFGNEGGNVSATETKVTGAKWHQVWLLRDGKKLPFIPQRFTDMKCPQPEHFGVQMLGNGGETIDIAGDPSIVAGPAGQ